jgi:hypothetical protein
MKTLLLAACKANQLDNWNNGDTKEGDSIFTPKTVYEQNVWKAIRDENRKLFQRSNCGKKST